MTGAQVRRLIVLHWRDAIVRAIQLGDDVAAYRLTRGLVLRCRELGLWHWR